MVVLTCVVVVATGAAMRERYREVALEQREGGLVFPELQHRIDAVTTIEISRAAGRFTLERGPNGWANGGAGGFPARQPRIRRVLAGLAGLAYFDPKTSRERLYPKLGVEDVAPGADSTRVSVSDSVGRVMADVIVGRQKINVAGLDRHGVYMRLPDSARAWLAAGTLDVRHDAPDWSERVLIDVPASAIAALRVTHADGETIELERTSPTDPKLTLTNLPAGTTIEHQYQIDYMASLLENLSFSDARRATPAEASERGGFEATVETQDGRVVRLKTTDATPDGTLWARIDARPSDTRAITDPAREDVERIRSTLAGWAFRLPRTITERLEIRSGDIVKTQPLIQ